MQPLCFVLMPFGLKRDPAGGPDIDFNRIYEAAIAPAISDAKLEPIRADHEVTGGIIHKPMFERLLLCEFAVADLTTANANVFYELGVRHAARPQTTLMLFAEQQPIPFDVALLRSIPYSLGAQNAFGEPQAAALRAALGKRLEEVRDLAYEQDAVDSPLVQLLHGYRCPEIAHLRTDVFRDRVAYSASLRADLSRARSEKPIQLARAAVNAVEQRLPSLDGVETGVLVDLFLSYRAVGAFDAMIELYEKLPEVVRRTVLVREQLAFALNRKAGEAPAAGREEWRGRATALLEGIIAERGPNSETCGLLGRIYKDRWTETRESEPLRARGFLRQAIKEYSRGFAADWRDAYPGINAVTLLDVEGSRESLEECRRLVPVVQFAVEQRLRGAKPDYWDHATLLELAVLAHDLGRANDHLADALASIREYFEPETTARNLALLQTARATRGTGTPALDEIIRALELAVQKQKGG